MELLARERDGSVVPYFKQGWLWTDGGLQADLPLTLALTLALTSPLPLPQP